MTYSEGKRGFTVSGILLRFWLESLFYPVTGKAVRWFSSFSRMGNDIIRSVGCLVCVQSGVFKGEYFCEVLSVLYRQTARFLTVVCWGELFSVVGRDEFSFITLLYSNNALI